MISSADDGWRPPDNLSQILSELRSGKANFHGWAPDIFVDWRVEKSTVDWMLDVVQEGWRTLETGAGHSTVVFAMVGSRHTAISPSPREHDRISAWCDERGVSMARVTFVNAQSQDALPAFSEQLDFVLIDGDHSFPIPFIDWYYTARQLRPGGLLVVDDTHLRTGSILRDFLAGEVTAGRWRLEAEFPRWVAFSRLQGDLIDPTGWQSQPYGAKPRGVPGVTFDALKERLPEPLLALGRRVRRRVESVRNRADGDEGSSAS